MSATLEGRSKWHTLFVGALVLIALFYFGWSSTAQIGFLGGDGPGYLMLANHLTPYSIADPVYDAVGRISRFPPGYSMLLAAFDASTDLHFAHWITTACLLIALVAFYYWLLLQRFDPPQAVLLVLVIAVLPQTWYAALTFQSEYLYLALSLLSLILLRRFEQSGSTQTLYLAAVVIAVTLLTREVGLSLLLPLMVCSWRRSRRAALVALAIAVVPVLDWHQLHRAPNSYDKILAYHYSSGGFPALRQQLLDELPALVDGFGSNFDFVEGFRPLTLPMGAVCLLCTLWRAVRLKLDALYVIANLAILVLWPFPEEATRFIWVLLPLLLSQPPLLLSEIRGCAPAAGVPRSALAVLGAAALTMTLPLLFFIVQMRQEAASEAAPDAAGYTAWYTADRFDAHESVGFESTLIQVLGDIQAIVPADDCILAARPDIINFFARRRSYFLPPESLSDKELEPALRARGCHYVFAYAVGDVAFHEPMYPSKRIEGFSEKLLERRSNNAPPHATPVCRLYRLK